MQESSQKDKQHMSKDKGLSPLLRFLEDVINKYIVSQWGDKYTFQFNGGDTMTELDRLGVLEKKVELGMTYNEARMEMGLTGTVEGGDIPNSGVVVQARGQEQVQQMQQQQQQDDMKNELNENTGGNGNASSKNPENMNSNSRDANNNMGKDGIPKEQDNPNSYSQTNKNNDWE